MFQNLGELALLLWRTLRVLPVSWRQREKIFDQFFEIGNASLLLVCIAICKELSPVMMSILIAGRIGSAMAAEIGSMRVYQEIDALRTMNISPIHYLVLPRLIAIAVALPLLVIFAILVGWLGGAFVCSANSRIDISFPAFFTTLRDIVQIKDVVNGVFKSFVFAWVIGVVSCHQGLITIGGPRGIGRSVTKAVVNSIVLIVIIDYILTRILLK